MQLKSANNDLKSYQLFFSFVDNSKQYFYNAIQKIDVVVAVVVEHIYPPVTRQN